MNRCAHKSFVAWAFVTSVLYLPLAAAQSVSLRDLTMNRSLADSFGDVIQQIQDPTRKTAFPVAIWREKDWDAVAHC